MSHFHLLEVRPVWLHVPILEVHWSLLLVCPFVKLHWASTVKSVLIRGFGSELQCVLCVSVRSLLMCLVCACRCVCRHPAAAQLLPGICLCKTSLPSCINAVMSVCACSSPCMHSCFPAYCKCAAAAAAVPWMTQCTCAHASSVFDNPRAT